MCNELDCAQCALYFCGVSSIPEQLLGAMKARGWSFRQLLEASGLKMARTSLQRKLRGEVTLYEDEIQALVDTLQVTVAFVPTNPPKRKRAA